MMLQRLQYRSPAGNRFELSEEVHSLLCNHKQCDLAASECGGILLGRVINSSDDFVVDQITLPMDGDKQTARSFFRNRDRHLAIARQHHTESAGTCGYLGEW